MSAANTTLRIEGRHSLQAFGALLILIMSLSSLSMVLATVALGATSAELVQTDDADRLALHYATAYGIHVVLETALTAEQIEDAETFRVVDSRTGRDIEIVRVTWSGGLGGGPYPRVDIWGPFEAVRHTDDRTRTPYVVMIRYPGDAANLKRVEVSIDASTSDSQASVLDRASDVGRLELEPMISDQADSLGFKYAFEYQANTFFGVERNRDVEIPPGKTAEDVVPRVLDLELKARGEVTTDPALDDFRGNMYFTFQGDYRWHPRVRLNVPQPDGTSVRRVYAYPVGVSIKGFEFETDQAFDVVNYTAKFQAVAAVPFSDAPVFWWHAKTGVNRPFVPLVVVAGYSAVARLDDAPDAARKLNDVHRFDFEAIYTIPLAAHVDFDFHWRGSLQPTDGAFEHLVEVGGTYFLGKRHESGIRVSYVNGSEAPTFVDVESVRVGWSLAFF